MREVVGKAADRGVALRVGVNAGSLPRSLEGEPDPAEAMVKAAEDELELLERLSFRDAVFSLKSSDVGETIRANVRFSRDHDHPLHLGVTEAGPLIPGIVRSTAGHRESSRPGYRRHDTGISLGTRCGRGNHRRRDPEGRRAENRWRQGHFLPDLRPNDVRCSEFHGTCIIFHTFRESATLTIAVMGCPVNGLGEARKADLGITGAGKMAILFRKGEIVRRVTYDQALEAFREEFDKTCEG